MTHRLLTKLITFDSTLQMPFETNSTVPHHVQRELQTILQTSNWYTSLSLHTCTPVTILDDNYPPQLRHIPNPPFVLYTKGDLTLFLQPLLAVIGTRQPTSYGEQVCKTLVPPIVEQKVVIVSGGAYGIDRASHETAIAAGGKTVAVLGSGFQHLYPKVHRPLFQKIATDHLLVSEYPPQTPPKRWNFPARNRIVSGLSQAICIIEAKRHSGTFSTVEHALHQGRDVFVVPGSIFSAASVGPLELLAEGAQPVVNKETLLEYFCR
ncbi:DNA-processing protein DprA [Bacillus fonticola]|uniref:DNA-processing protein DprA n=1 Tax=Bacillus fonticola TaxID=2728853 RepID=UPI001D153AD3|nr:DNA-processing protein DprA [Bacillus fonticola]